MKALIAAVAACLLFPATASAADIQGTWATPRGGALIEISHCGGNSLCGKFVSSDAIKANPSAKDNQNRASALRSRNLKGIATLWGFSGGAAKWTGGHIYNPEDGKTYKGAIEMTGADSLRVKGCIASFLNVQLCGIQGWKRVK